MALLAYLCVIGREYLFPRVNTDILEVETGRCVESPSLIAEGVTKDHHLSGRHTLDRGQTTKLNEATDV